MHISDTQVDIIEFSGLTDEYVKAITPMIDRDYAREWTVLSDEIRGSEVMDDLALQIVNINDKHKRCIEEER